MKNLTNRWNKEAKKILLGKTIIQVKYVESEEASKYMWSNRPISFVLDDGTRLIVMSDDEGNNGGTLCYLNKNVDDVLPVLSLEDK